MYVCGMENCPSCNEKIKSGFLGSNYLIDNDKSILLKKYSSKPKSAYCTKCFPFEKQNTIYAINSLISQSEHSLAPSIARIPIITINNPSKWDYTVCEMVSAQTTTGTGVITELLSDFTDTFGMQSNRTSNKLKAGEDACKFELRKAAAAINANAIIGVDIDYAEVGGGKGMLMVCMAGTAVKLNNLSILDEKSQELLNQLPMLLQEVQLLRLDKLNLESS